MRLAKTPSTHRAAHLLSPQVNRNRGFSLIELLIVVAVLGVIFAVAYPSYYSYVLKTHRTDGKSALVNLANDMEKYYFTHNEYPATIATLRQNSTSDDGHYELAVDAATARGFELSAKPVGQQSKDKHCGTFTLDSDGIKGIRNGAGSAERCW